MPVRIEIVGDPSAADLEVVSDGLLAADAWGGVSAYVPLVVFARDEKGRVVGGVVGNTGPPWFYISALWVTERLRGQGLGSRLMDCAEQEASSRGCAGAYLDTFSLPALGFYRAHGYESFGELPGRGVAPTRHFLRKTLAVEQRAGV
jgi:GNAT superfamily N-acetyltransferase